MIFIKAEILEDRMHRKTKKGEGPYIDLGKIIKKSPNSPLGSE